MKSFPGILMTISLTVLFSSVSCRQQTVKPTVDSFPASYLEEMTISRLHQGYMKGEFTVHRIVSDYIERINAIDKNGPCLNSVITLNPDAIAIADSLDKVFQRSGLSGPLFGVPVMLKDNIDTHDKMPNTGGSRALARSFPGKDSYVAERLRKAGAIIIAKANLS
ncbi:MAG: amidase, partial [Bacteroidales bacterium]|nr:amidase [Bacteroidales bacterium]